MARCAQSPRERPKAHRTADRCDARAPRGRCRNRSPIVPHQSIGGRALVAVVAIMTFLASLTTGAVMLVRACRRLAVRGRARGHDPGAARRPAAISRPTVRKRGRDRARVRRHRRGAALYQGGIGAPARALARQRACARRPAGAARDRGQARAGADARSRAALRKTLAEQGAGRHRSTIIAAGSTACARWPIPSSPAAS